MVWIGAVLLFDKIHDKVAPIKMPNPAIVPHNEEFLS